MKDGPERPLEFAYYREPGDERRPARTVGNWADVWVRSAHKEKAMTDDRDALAEALRDVCRAATRQLAFMGKGKEPSPRLQEALDAANAALIAAGFPAYDVEREPA